MLSIIKTAIITIIISFISGVLLDGYKNFAPRILCSMEKPVHLKINNKKVWAFTFVMRNISNKTIHNLSLNIQGHFDNLRIDEARITKGLKFETSNENNNYNVSIPFLSKNDEFSTKIFVESPEGIVKKPIVTLRSPENFKQINGFCKNGYFATIAGIPKDISESITKRKHKKQGTNNSKIRNSKDKHFFNYRKVLITMMGITVLIYAVLLVNEYHNKMSDEFTGGDNKFNTQQAGASLKQSESTEKSSNEESKVSQGSTKGVGNTVSAKNDNNTNNNSNKNKASNDSSNNKSSEELNKDQSQKETKTNHNSKTSNGSTSKNNNTTSENKEKSEADSKNAKTDNNKTSSTETSKTDANNSDNTQNKSNESSPKSNSEKTPEPGKGKEQGNSSTNQAEPKATITAPGNE